ncbi:MAG: tyrosine--tRNA ligase, partial [Clostridia bacterium]|nr:tyrosine--tRNA ligase [Clostridia bacterium]
NGVKFGKSEGNAVWLDQNKTSSYELYQFLINSDDAVIIDYLKRLTFLSREEIEEIEKQHLEAPHLRIAQKRLAEEIISDLHGHDAFLEAQRISELLFAGQIQEVPVKDLRAGFKNVPHFEIQEDNLVNVLVGTKICSSKREANEFIANGAISVNGEIVKDSTFMIDKTVAIDNEIVIIRHGKKKYFFCSIK